MPAHVVGAERDEERRAQIVLRERLEQPRHAVARSAERVDVDAQPERRRAHGALPDDAFAPDAAFARTAAVGWAAAAGSAGAVSRRSR